MGVDLDGDLVLGARSQHLLDVDLLTGPALESGHVADDRGVRIGDGLD
jgi:hypothetical protein